VSDEIEYPFMVGREPNRKLAFHSFPKDITGMKVKNPGPQDLVLLLPPERGLGSCPLRRQERVIPKGFIRN
jgi:hypothetical protein